ncbi:DNA replication protein DnaC [Thalassobacillus cyri]|uniref:DNA replication protein DnaC n=1 Tax=Thalassobacillus cyri TaxID=571932 RepID=A0A1H4H2H4_9BACI|nr:DNA replication protein DnaC [Thalassobacillus cyri]
MKERLVKKADDLKSRAEYLNEHPEERDPDTSFDCEVCEDQVWIPMRRFKNSEEEDILEGDFFSGQVHPSQAGNWATKVHWQCWCSKRKAEKKRIQKVDKQSGLSRRFKQRIFDNYTFLDPKDFPAEDYDQVMQLVESQRSAYQTAIDYAESFETMKEDGRSFGLLGSYGTGKTHLLGAITNELNRKGVQAVFVNTSEFFGQLKESFEKDENGKWVTTTRASELIEMMKTCDHLSLDDLGKEKPTDFVLDVLYRIVNYRYENMLPINFTTNASLEEMEQQVGGAIYRRMVEMASGYLKEICGESYEQLLLRKL